MPPSPPLPPWRPSRAARPPPSWQVTCNYAARQQGVTKLMGTAEARKRCPHIALVRWVLRLERLPTSRGWLNRQGQPVLAGMATVKNKWPLSRRPLSWHSRPAGLAGAGFMWLPRLRATSEAAIARISVCCPMQWRGPDPLPRRLPVDPGGTAAVRYGREGRAG